ncbi:MAG TPA: STAS domain-containing protein [Planctomycetaceae bacterium]|nr:STAS domain-containing protein [Planctomycetaceae bacterium]
MTIKTRDFRVEQFEDVTIVRFTTDLIDSSNYQPIADELKGLVDQHGVRKLLVNLKNVEFLFSFALGHFAALLKKLKQAGGDLRFCNLRPPVHQIFVVTQFNRLVDVYESEHAALEDWTAGAAPAPGPPDTDHGASETQGELPVEV